jgi:NSS family neurotransmitter:Na+ symporter
MPELLEEQRESWGTRGGFVLAAVGSAVGLGNLWRFPYELYDHGGGAFLVPYIVAVFVIGVPMLILEFSLGHFTQRAAPQAFARGHGKLEFVGWWSTLLGFVIVTFYTVILAYCFSFLNFSIRGIFNGGELPWAGHGLEGVRKAEEFFFQTYLGHTPGHALGAIRWNIFWPLVLTWATMYLCICRGVRLVGRIVWLTVPLPWLMLLILAVRGLTLEGSMEGLAYYLNPDFSQLASAQTWRFAFGQAFFSLSLAFGGVMVTYASFLHAKSDLNNNAAIITLADFATSFVAGLAVFATLGAMAFVTRQAGMPVEVESVAKGGPSLAFIAFPYALAQLPYSAYFSFVFFLALVTLGIDSAFSITESVLAAIVDKTGWRRSVVLPLMSVVGLACGLVFITRGGLNWLGTVGDFIDGTWGIAFLGLLECLVLGWLWRVDVLRRHANERSDWALGRWWNYLIRIGIPVMLSALFFWSLFDDLTKAGGFIRGGDGRFILANCVGLGLMAAVPVAAIAISAVRGWAGGNGSGPQGGRAVRGNFAAAAAFVAAVVSTVMAAALFRNEVLGRACPFAPWWILPAAAAAIMLGNYLLDRHDGPGTTAAWPARWAGMLSTISTGGFIALCLIKLAGTAAAGAGPELELAAPAVEQAASRGELSGVSYLILAVVLLLIIGGLGWCFYRALAAAGRGGGEQHPERQ